MNFGLAPFFLGCFHRCHRFADAAPSLLELPKLRMSAGQDRECEWCKNCSSRCPIGRNPRDQHFDGFGSPASQGQHAAPDHHSDYLPIRGAFFLGQSDKLLGLWAAEKLGLTGPAAEAYAKEVVMADIESTGDHDMFGKIRKDLDTKGVSLSDHQIRRTMDELMARAIAEIKASG